MSVSTGLDRLLAEEAEKLRGRRYGLLCHRASLTRELEPCHLALVRLGAPPSVLFAPEHGFYGVEQDMVAASERRDPLTGLPILSLYGDSAQSLVPTPDAFAGVDLLVIDLQDIGARYYTFAATAIWSAEVALERGCEVLVLDRPNPLGGARVEGNLRESGLESFVGAFRLPVRHGLTLGELALLEARRRRWPREGLRVIELAGWRRCRLWSELGRPWIAPSPNIPSFATVLVYPGACLVEGTELSEGRGTTRPFELIGAPGLDPVALCERLQSRGLPGVRCVPSYFRPQFHKHAGQVCAGIEVVVTDARSFPAFRFGVELLRAARELAPGLCRWRERPYEFVTDRPAVDLLAGSQRLRRALDPSPGQSPGPPPGNGTLEKLDDWIASWSGDEAAFTAERQEILLYPD